jgi:uncharacterized protein (DUF488 family)
MTKLHTIGYEGSVISDFLATLNALGINLLIDVRDVPISRKKGFSKARLSAHLADVGIDYLHLKGLGDPKAGRLAARAGRYDEFRHVFSAHMLTDAAREHLAIAVESARGRSACLLCFERDHTHCHRSIVAKEMAALADFELQHLGVKMAAHSGLSPERMRQRSGAHAFVG